MSLARISGNPVRCNLSPSAIVGDVKNMEICGDGLRSSPDRCARTFSIEVRALASPAIAEKLGLWMKMSLGRISRRPVRCNLPGSATSVDIRSVEICGDGVVRVDAPRAARILNLGPRASDSCRRCDFPKIFEKRGPPKNFLVRM
jgi:hypothetical protein